MFPNHKPHVELITRNNFFFVLLIFLAKDVLFEFHKRGFLHKYHRFNQKELIKSDQLNLVSC
jgi:hypothetical protein